MFLLFLVLLPFAFHAAGAGPGAQSTPTSVGGSRRARLSEFGHLFAHDSRLGQFACGEPAVPSSVVISARFTHQIIYRCKESLTTHRYVMVGAPIIYCRGSGFWDLPPICVFNYLSTGNDIHEDVLTDSKQDTSLVYPPLPEAIQAALYGPPSADTREALKLLTFRRTITKPNTDLLIFAMMASKSTYGAHMTLTAVDKYDDRTEELGIPPEGISGGHRMQTICKALAWPMQREYSQHDGNDSMSLWLSECRVPLRPGQSRPDLSASYEFTLNLTRDPRAAADTIRVYELVVYHQVSTATCGTIATQPHCMAGRPYGAHGEPNIVFTEPVNHHYEIARKGRDNNKSVCNGTLGLWQPLWPTKCRLMVPIPSPESLIMGGGGASNESSAEAGGGGDSATPALVAAIKKFAKDDLLKLLMSLLSDGVGALDDPLNSADLEVEPPRVGLDGTAWPPGSNEPEWWTQPAVLYGVVSLLGTTILTMIVRACCLCCPRRVRERYAARKLAASRRADDVAASAGLFGDMKPVGRANILAMAAAEAAQNAPITHVASKTNEPSKRAKKKIAAHLLKAANAQAFYQAGAMPPPQAV